MRPLPSTLNRNAPQSNENFQYMEKLVQELYVQLDKGKDQGPEQYQQKVKAKGKLLARERLELLIDQGAPFLELMPLAGVGSKHMTPGAGVITGLGFVSQTMCLVVVNVPTLKGGALNKFSVQKILRLDEIAMENKLPVIYLTESAGADLSQQSEVFNLGGQAFRNITQRSKEGIPSISVVFGSSTAGGAYVPGMADYVVMVDKQAKTYLAGPPLVKQAINEIVDDETLGGAMMHARQSGLCDYMASDEYQAIAKARQIVEHFKKGKSPQSFSTDFENPVYPAEELFHLISSDPKVPFDAREIIARLVDGSHFDEFKPLYGESLVTGFARIRGQYIGVLANNGVIFSQSAEKGSHFIQICNKRKIPLLFLQNTTGFMVGKDAEAGGIIKHGAKLINAVSNSEMPAITIMIGNSYGAGNYGMCGRAYKPRFLFSWPNSKLAVMGAQQLAGVMKALNPELPVKELIKQLEQQSSAYFSTGQVWDDGIIDPRQTREVLALCYMAIEQGRYHQNDQSRLGIFRM